jgi:hypothetical protein
MGSVSPKAAEDQDLLLHEKVVGDDRVSTGSQELGERGEETYEEDE